jgi:hypothetical protein
MNVQKWSKSLRNSATYRANGGQESKELRHLFPPVGDFSSVVVISFQARFSIRDTRHAILLIAGIFDANFEIN